MITPFDHRKRIWGIWIEDMTSNYLNPRMFYWNGVGWTDQEEFCQLLTAERAAEAVRSIDSIPGLRLAKCGPTLIKRVVR